MAAFTSLQANLKRQCHEIFDFRNLTCKFLREFTKKSKTVLLMGYSGAGGTDSWKNQKQKIPWHCPFKGTNRRNLLHLSFRTQVPLGLIVFHNLRNFVDSFKSLKAHCRVIFKLDYFREFEQLLIRLFSRIRITIKPNFYFKAWKGPLRFKDDWSCNLIVLSL